MLKLLKIFFIIFILNLAQIIFASDQANNSFVEKNTFTPDQHRFLKLLLFAESNLEIEEPLPLSGLKREMYVFASSEFEAEIDKDIFEISWTILKKIYCDNETQMRKLFMEEKKEASKIARAIRNYFKSNNLNLLLQLKAQGRIEDLQEIGEGKFKYLMPNSEFFNKFLRVYNDLESLKEKLKKHRIICDEKSFIYIINFLTQENPNFFRLVKLEERSLFLKTLFQDIQTFCPEDTTNHIYWIQNEKKLKLQNQAAYLKLENQGLEQKRIELKLQQKAEKEKQKKIHKFEQKVYALYARQIFFTWFQFLNDKKEDREKELKKPNQDHLNLVEESRQKRVLLDCFAGKNAEKILDEKVNVMDSFEPLDLLDKQKWLIRQQKEARRSNKRNASSQIEQNKFKRYGIDWDRAQEAKHKNKGVIGCKDSGQLDKSCFCLNGQWLGLYEESRDCVFCGQKSVCR